MKSRRGIWKSQRAFEEGFFGKTVGDGRGTQRDSLPAFVSRKREFTDTSKFHLAGDQIGTRPVYPTVYDGHE